LSFVVYGKYCKGEQIKDETNGKRITQRINEKYIKFYSENLMWRDHLRNKAVERQYQSMGRIQVTLDRGQRQALVNTVKKLRESGKFLDYPILTAERDGERSRSPSFGDREAAVSRLGSAGVKWSERSHSVTDM
jgi:hypothetical protein